MKRRDQEDFLKEVFADEGLDALREDTLTRGLSAMRIQRRILAVRAGALVVVPIMVFIGAMLWQRQMNVSISPTSVAMAPAIPTGVKFYPATVASDAPPVTPISDTELLNLFGDHPAALIGGAGHQRLVVFDEPQRAVR